MIDGADRLRFFDATRRARILRSGLAVVMIGTPILIIVLSSKVLPLTSLRRGYANQPKNWLVSVKQVDAFLPDNVCVAADNHLAPHLAARDWTTVAQVKTPDPDFYAIDLFAPDTGGNPPAPKPAAVYSDAIQHGYHVVLTAGTWIVLQAPDYAGPSRACRPLGPGK